MSIFFLPFVYSAFNDLLYNLFLFMFGPTCANNSLPSISLVVIIVSAQKWYRPMPSTVCSYPMVSSTWSCPKASMSLMCFHACNWTVCWYMSMGASAPTLLSEPPPSLHWLYSMYWSDVLYVLDYLFLSHSTYHIIMYHVSCPIFHYMLPFTHSHTHTPCQSLYTLKL